MDRREFASFLNALATAQLPEAVAVGPAEQYS
jgi:hypothetical protein